MTDPIAAEARAVERGNHAMLQPDGSFRVRCGGSCGEEITAHVVRPERLGDDRPFRISCDCPAGRYRLSSPVPCTHAAIVGRRLEREGKATWSSGVWWPARVSEAAAERIRTRKAKGACPICKSFLEIELRDDEEDVPTAAAAHKPACAAEHAKRRRASRELGAVDLWERTSFAPPPRNES